MSDQTASASEASTVIQSARDTVVGYSATDVQVIINGVIGSIADQVPKFIAIANETIDRRIGEFEQKLLERFSEKEHSDIDAFKDPDFQHVVLKARDGYARNGDETTCEMLVDLIAQRSQLPSKSRLSLSLNQAVEKAALLTKTEFAELAFSYLVTRAHAKGLFDFAGLVKFIEEIIPLGSNVAIDRFSYEYLESQSLASLSETPTVFYDHIKSNYPSLLSLGFSWLSLQVLFMQLRNHTPVLPHLFKCIHNGKRLQLFVKSKDEFFLDLSARGVSLWETSLIWERFERTIMKEERFWFHFVGLSKKNRAIQSIWSHTPISRMKLTSVGVAIGHCYALRHLPKYEYDLARSIG